MKLTLQQINEELKGLNEWEFSYSDNSITKKFQFKDFKESMKFANKIAELAEKHEHHPDILINYNIVKIILTTHSEDGITNKDIKLAKEINSL
ncbi:4a-hydroxytetrahydrobiopterin dehydratase [Candidatus Woesearchaeota archaeon]|nr:4a-hydroxytetrahydrobiopterin dehydratase [Candidatus Woesearchaeota archaeon]